MQPDKCGKRGPLYQFPCRARGDHDGNLESVMTLRVSGGLIFHPSHIFITEFVCKGLLNEPPECFFGSDRREIVSRNKIYFPTLGLINFYNDVLVSTVSKVASYVSKSWAFLGTAKVTWFQLKNGDGCRCRKVSPRPAFLVSCRYITG